MTEARTGTLAREQPLRLKRRLLVVIACGLMTGTLWVLGRSPGLVESAYASSLGPLLARSLARVSGVVGVSVAEILVFLFISWLLARATVGVVQVARGRRSAWNAIACGSLRLIVTASILLVGFTLLWGVNYARPDAVARLHWEGATEARDDGESGTQELARLCEELVEAANRDYERANGSTDLGSPSAPKAPIDEIDSAIDAGYERVARALELGASFAAARGRAKPVLASVVMSHLGISGFYFPFTGEANYNRLVPPSELPITIAHEKAHQRCIAREDEASFFGFLACAHTNDRYARYSGYLYAQRVLLRELERLDRERVRDLAARRLPGVQRDVDASNAYWQRYRGALQRIGESVNDRYLKLQGVEGGIESYGRSARLLVIFSRTHHGTCVIAESEPAR